MRLFAKYLRSHRLGIAAFGLLCVLFLVSFALYRLPVAAAAYPAVLGAVLSAVVLVLDFLRTKARRKRLEDAGKQTSETVEPWLPEPRTPEEEAYTELVRRLCREADRLRRDAEQRERERTDYYTVWAHQIKTPISAMDLMLQSENSDTARRLSSELRRVERYAEMVLTYQRLDAENGDWVFREYEVDVLVRRAVRRFSQEFILRKLKMEDVPTGRTIVTDEKWFGFVLEQLLSNALKYTREGGIRIFAEGDTLVIRDSGIGIAPEDLPRVFDRGYTGYNGRTDRRATGLGLYLCRRICEKLNLPLTLESTPGVGTDARIGLKQYGLRAE